ncbi:MAG: transposase [Gammaproteobacteria bacterium]
MQEQRRPPERTIRAHFRNWRSGLPTEAQCREYLARLRRPTGFRCSQCDSQDEPWVTGRDRLRCKGCRCDISLTGGTLFERTRKPLRDWYHAMC